MNRSLVWTEARLGLDFQNPPSGPPGTQPPISPRSPREYFLIMRPQLWLNPGWGSGTGRREAEEGST